MSEADYSWGIKKISIGSNEEMYLKKREGLFSPSP
jgi:hypothetical protein